MRVQKAAHLEAITGSKLQVCVVEVAPQFPGEEHAHEQEQISLLLSGELFVEADGSETMLNPGDAMILPSGVPHRAFTREKGATSIEVFTPPRPEYS